ncbi:HEPN domain-containing protein [Cellulomonas sp. NPDC057328]|uniref:HEPN domain-containing protein n=1 Tax=Cellulomonas sp. NPDC057328 TaxID=3346101 RepID=UPI0036290EC3
MIVRWERGRVEVDRLIADGRIERVAASRQLADLLLTQARAHLGTAAASAAADPTAAFQVAYDAARKSLAAVLAVQGLRARALPGAHAVLLDVVLAQLDPPLGPTLRHFDWLRRIRNAAEYPSLESPGIALDDAQDAVDLASAIVDASERVVPSMPVY